MIPRTCESMPGSPPPFLFFVRVRGEPGNKASWCVCMAVTTQGNSESDQGAQSITIAYKVILNAYSGCLWDANWW